MLHGGRIVEPEAPFAYAALYSADMQFERVESLDDPRIALYRNLKDGELATAGERFVVEGHFVVQRVLVSDFPVESVLIADRKLDDMKPFLREGLPVYLVPDPLVKHIVGFQFHTGVMAIARRKPEIALEEVMAEMPEQCTLMVLPETSSLQNMGSLIRVAAAFGVDAVLIGPGSVDPFYRLPIRVSMGTCFNLPLVRTNGLETDLRRLSERWGVRLIATVLDEDATPLSAASIAGRKALLFGGEGYGLDRTWVDLCDERVTIPMKLGTDSLNVAVSAGVFLWHYTK